MGRLPRLSLVAIALAGCTAEPDSSSTDPRPGGKADDTSTGARAKFDCSGLVRALFVDGDYVDFGVLFPKQATAEVDLASPEEDVELDDFVYQDNGTEPMVIEHDVTEKIFTSPRQKRTEDYITGRFG